MKNTPASIIAGLTSSVARPYLTLKMEFASGTIYSTNLPYDVTIGGDVYSSDGGLSELSPPQLSSTLDRETYRIRLIDHNNFYKQLFETGVVGTPVTVQLGIEGNYTDLDVLYKGVIDATFLETDPSEGLKSAVIECSSPFGSLERTNDRRTDRRTQRVIDPNDSCFDKIHNQVQSTEIRWGKKP